MITDSVPMTSFIRLLLALFALAVDLQSHFQSFLSVSIDLLFHENWRHVLMKDPPLRRSIVEMLSNKYGGTQGTRKVRWLASIHDRVT